MMIYDLTEAEARLRTASREYSRAQRALDEYHPASWSARSVRYRTALLDRVAVARREWLNASSHFEICVNEAEWDRLNGK